MATIRGESMTHVRACLSVVLLVCSVSAAAGASVTAWSTTSWMTAHATYYGGNDASGTMGGSCGYGNLYTMGYGTATTALSNALFNNGLSCGACFQIECLTSQTNWCYPGKSITVTATNECPPGSYGGWCEPPKCHFDLSYPMFTQLARYQGGVIPVQYRRVTCNKQGGIKFTIQGNPWFILTLITNVGGGGDVSAVAIRGSRSSWYNSRQNWGVNWEASGQPELVGQALCYRVTLGSGSTMEFDNVTPSNWGFSQTYQANNNFY
ncbi:unnamed protein product [Calypogeia fissa]